MSPGLREVDAELAALRPSRVSNAVRRRIVDRTLERLEPKRGRRPLYFASAAAVAACAALLVFTSPTREASLAILPSSGKTVHIGDHRIDVSRDAQTALVDRTPEHAVIVLARGRVDARVQKLGPGESFRVETEEVLVEVVGTQFSVSVDDGCSAIRVTEGRVRVTDRLDGSVRFLTPGQAFRACPEPVLAEPGPAQAEAMAPTRIPAAPRERAAPGEALVRGALEGIASPEKRAQTERALQQYLRQYPRGLFEEEARYYLFVSATRAGDATLARQRGTEFTDRFPAGRRGAKVREWLSQ